MKESKFLIIPVLLLLLSACQKDANIKQKDFAFVRTVDYENNTINGITLIGEVLDLGREPIADYGFEYSNKYDDNVQRFSLKAGGISIESFRKRFETEFEANIVYKYRAYVKHAYTTVYGNENSFRCQGSLEPIVISMNPNAGNPGSIVRIEGKYFDKNPEKTSIRVGSMNARIISSSTSHIEFEIPPWYTTGSVPVKLFTRGREIILSKIFTYKEPKINEIIIDGNKPGSIIKITGDDLILNDNEVDIDIYFNNLRATVLSGSQTEIRVIIPSNFRDYIEDVNVTELKLKLGSKEFIFPVEFTIKHQWEKLETTPLNNTYKIAPPPVENGIAYVFETGTENKLFTYDIQENNWNHISQYPGPYNSYIAFINNGVLYKLDGTSNRQFWAYNINEDKWTEKEPSPFEFELATHVIFNEKLYILINNQELWTYSLDNEQFEKLNTFPGSLSGSTKLYINENKIFARASQFTWEYQSTQDIWNQLYATPDNNHSIGYNSIAYVLNNTVYSYFGYKNLYKYDQSINEWLYFCNYPWPLVDDYFVSYFIYNNEAYFIVQEEGDTRLYKFKD